MSMSKRVNGYLFPKTGSKKRRILNDLMSGATMTPLKAMAYGTHRLAAVIHELKNLNGFVIQASERYDGNGTLYTEYSMNEGSLQSTKLALNDLLHNRFAA